MKIKDIFAQKKPVLSFEIFPPKKEQAFKDIDCLLKELTKCSPDFISVTFGAGGTSALAEQAKNPTVEIAGKIKHRYGIESVAHLTCLSYDEAEVTSILSELKSEGIENILALRGDINPNIKPKNDFAHASDLIGYIRKSGDFGISAACYPEGHPQCQDYNLGIDHLKEKVDAGATHLISQLFFDNDQFFYMRDKARQSGIEVPIEAGIMPVINRAQIERMVSMCGVAFPTKFRKILDKYADNEKALADAGIAYAINQIVELLSHDVDGIHLYVMNKPEIAEKICSAIASMR
ncbi:MAG: methylenetetrahydrofolate reductase [NAD(P)H] [Clostridia bacterium]|nr:methylenetetrahydrofolate reductase [NAD(P)H] [Clostridia bacterium]